MASIAFAGNVPFTGNPSMDSDGNTVTTNVSSSNNVYASKRFQLAIMDYWVNTTMQTQGKVGFESTLFRCEASVTAGLTLGSVTQDVWTGAAWTNICDSGIITLPTADTNFDCVIPNANINTGGNTYLRCRIQSTAVVTDNTARFDFLVLNLVDTIAPVVTLNSPANGAVFNVSTVTFNFTTTDAYNDTQSCSLFIDGSSVETNASALNNTPTTFTRTGLSDANHTWRVECTDKAGNTGVSATRSFIVDMTPPTIILHIPLNNTENLGSIAPFGFLPIDLLTPPMNCSILLDGIINQTNPSSQNNTETQFVISGISNGVHNWSIACTDQAGNQRINGTRLFMVMTQCDANGSNGNDGNEAACLVFSDSYITFPAGLLIGIIIAFLILPNRTGGKRR